MFGALLLIQKNRSVKQILDQNEIQNTLNLGNNLEASRKRRKTFGPELAENAKFKPSRRNTGNEGRAV